jgi:hypothetical protein
MLLGEVWSLLLGWWGTEHMQITKTALEVGLSVLTLNGVLGHLGKTFQEMKDSMSTLWLSNCCQDFDVGNACGLVGIEIAGGQVAHFMRDQGQDKLLAYMASYRHMREIFLKAHRYFAEAFPEHHSHGILGRAKEAISTGISFQLGVHSLGAGLHTLQDSFSPAHASREDGIFCIRDVYCWDANNKNERTDHNGDVVWPGHKPYDRKNCAFCPPISLGHFAQAEEASKEVIVCVMEHLHLPSRDFNEVLCAKLDHFLKQDIAG